MTPRELAGEINRATECFVCVHYTGSPNGFVWLKVSKPQAKAVVDDAREEGIEHIDCTVSRGVVNIGSEPFEEEEEEETEEVEEEDA